MITILYSLFVGLFVCFFVSLFLCLFIYWVVGYLFICLFTSLVLVCLFTDISSYTGYVFTTLIYIVIMTPIVCSATNE